MSTSCLRMGLCVLQRPNDENFSIFKKNSIHRFRCRPPFFIYNIPFCIILLLLLIQTARVSTNLALRKIFQYSNREEIPSN